MTPQIATLLVILGIALVLFSSERLPVDVVGLGVLLTLILTRLITPEQAFRGFGSETVLMLLGLFILTASLASSGVIEIFGRIFLERIGNHPRRMSVAVMMAASTMSSFMSNTAATAFFVPIVMGLARRLRVSASRFLMPLAFASILASSVTLVGTSTNIVVSGLMTQFGMAPMGVFELTPVGIPIVVVGLVYMVLVGQRMIPDRSIPDQLTNEFALRPFLTEVVLLPGSLLTGKTLGESGLGKNFDFTVLRVTRGEHLHLAPQADYRLAAGDELLIEGYRDEILKIKDVVGVSVVTDAPLSDPDLQTNDTHLAEVIVLPRSPLIGRQLINMDLRETFGLQVLAINRHEGTIHRKISQVALQMGDVLLVQGPQASLSTLEKNDTLRVLGTMVDKSINYKRARISLSIFVGVLLLAVFEVVALPVAMLLGSLVAFLTHSITPEEAYREVEWKAIILIACMLAFGTAMDITGTARYLAAQIAMLTGHSDPVWILSGFFLLTVVLTQPMSNQAAAAVVLPVAIQTAVHLGLNPRPFAMMIAIAASTSFITPLEPACLIVYGLGRYRFFDFLRVGTLLTVLVYIVAILLVPRIWYIY